jgi:hypothetical protein
MSIQSATQHGTRALPPIPTYTIGDDLVILVGVTTLVSSKSNPGQWWPIEFGRCICPAFAGIPGKFEGRGTCRHVRAAAEAEIIDRATSLPEPDPTHCRRCGVQLSTRRLDVGSCCTCSIHEDAETVEVPRGFLR